MWCKVCATFKRRKSGTIHWDFPLFCFWQGTRRIWAMFALKAFRRVPKGFVKGFQQGLLKALPGRRCAAARATCCRVIHWAYKYIRPRQKAGADMLSCEHAKGLALTWTERWPYPARLRGVLDARAVHCFSQYDGTSRIKRRPYHRLPARPITWWPLFAFLYVFRHIWQNSKDADGNGLDYIFVDWELQFKIEFREKRGIMFL